MWRWVAARIKPWLEVRTWGAVRLMVEDEYLKPFEKRIGEDLAKRIAVAEKARECQKCGMLYVSGRADGDEPPQQNPQRNVSEYWNITFTTCPEVIKYRSSDRHCPRCYGEAVESVRLQAWARDNASAAKECRDKCEGRPVLKFNKPTRKKRGK